MDNSLTATLLKVWMWAVPVIMVIAGLLFAGIAAADESWGLFAMMLILAVFGVVLLVLHWWVLYRFGKGPP